jgi:hypothetical protein
VLSMPYMVRFKLEHCQTEVSSFPPKEATYVSPGSERSTPYTL